MITKDNNKYQRHTLTNGVRLITIPMDGVKTVTAMIAIGAGSRYETKKINGISHFLEHMVFKGTKKRPSALEISSIIDGIGGEFNAFTGKEEVAFYIKSASSHLELLLDVLSDMLLNSVYKLEELNRERGVIIEEINMYEDLPMRKVAELYEELVWGDQPMGWDIAGKKEIIQKISRTDILRYINAHYAPENLVVAIAGNFESNRAVELVEKYLGGFGKRKYDKFIPTKEAQSRPKLLVRYKKTDQAHLCLGVRAFAVNHPDRYILEVLNAILGGGMSSRLFINVRERRGLAYYIRSSADLYSDTGNLVAQAGIDLKRVDEALRVMVEEFGKMTKEKVDKEELERGKEFLSGRLLLELEDTKNVAARYGLDELIERRIIWVDELVEKVKQVSQEDILRVAKALFDDRRLNFAIIGPFKSKENFEKILTFQ
jgi:predicted Zn-dependent peptidase